jgi:hypothetical protein
VRSEPRQARSPGAPVWRLCPGCLVTGEAMKPESSRPRRPYRKRAARCYAQARQKVCQDDFLRLPHLRRTSGQNARGPRDEPFHSRADERHPYRALLPAEWNT